MMAREPEDACPNCGKWTSKGLEKLALHYRNNPPTGIDLSRPLSELVGGIRSELTNTRGKLNDIAAAFTGWSDDMKMVEGLLTCGLISLHWVMDRMKEVEKEAKEQDAET